MKGKIKGKILSEAQLSPNLSSQVGEELGWDVPKIEENMDTKIENKSKKNETLLSQLPSPKKNKDFDDDESETINPFDDFLTRMDELDEEGGGIEDISTAGLITGLKSWLNFGSSVIQNSVPDVDRKKVYLMGHRESDKAIKGPARTDDKLTRKAEEKTSRITSEFCSWLTTLPPGEDDTVNNMSESHIKALFDTAHAANPNKSKLAEGLKFWVKFGEQVTGASSLVSDKRRSHKLNDKLWGQVSKKQVLNKSRGPNIASITTEQIAKEKFRKKVKKQIHEKKRTKHRKYRKLDKIEPVQDDGENLKKRFNRKQYGVWFMKPTSWEDRFLKKRDATTDSPLQREIVKERTSYSEDPVKDGTLSKLDSTKNFASFLEHRKPNYETPDFLRNILLQ